MNRLKTSRVFLLGCKIRWTIFQILFFLFFFLKLKSWCVCTYFIFFFKSFFNFLWNQYFLHLFCNTIVSSPLIYNVVSLVNIVGFCGAWWPIQSKTNLFSIVNWSLISLELYIVENGRVQRGTEISVTIVWCNILLH